MSLSTSVTSSPYLILLRSSSTSGFASWTADRTASSAASVCIAEIRIVSAQTEKFGSIPTVTACVLNSDAQKLWMVDIRASGNCASQFSSLCLSVPVAPAARSSSIRRTRWVISSEALSVKVRATSRSRGFSFEFASSSSVNLRARTSVLPAPAPLRTDRFSFIRSFAAACCGGVRGIFSLIGRPPWPWPISYPCEAGRTDISAGRGNSSGSRVSA